MGARGELADLRGVRGERLVLRTREIGLQRPVRLLHPRHPIYVVPWGDGLFMLGATVIESDDAGPVTVRSALELLGSAYALHPAFAEAEIVEMGAGVRPAFADNVPKIVVRGPHHPRQRPLPPRLPAGPRAWQAGGRLPRDRRHRQPGVRRGGVGWVERSAHDPTQVRACDLRWVMR